MNNSLSPIGHRSSQTHVSIKNCLSWKRRNCLSRKPRNGREVEVDSTLNFPIIQTDDVPQTPGADVSKCLQRDADLSTIVLQTDHIIVILLFIYLFIYLFEQFEVLPAIQLMWTCYTHPPKYTQRTATTPGTSSPTLLEWSSLTSHRELMNMEVICETGPPAYRPYPRRLESLTICGCNCKGSTFSLECWSGRSRTHDLPHGSPVLNQLSHWCAVMATRLYRFIWDTNSRLKSLAGLRLRG